MQLNDAPEILKLPHPVRLDAALGLPMDTHIFERAGVLERLKPYLADEHCTSDWIIKHVPGMLEIGQAYFGLIGAHNMGTYLLNLARARLRAQGDPIVQLTPALQAMLAETDLARDLPAEFFRSPYPLAYLEFARPNPLQLANQYSGLHECEGAYLGFFELPAGDEIFQFSAQTKALKLDPSKPVRVVEIVVTGSPVGKQHALDDASDNLMLLIQDEDECLQDVLDRHIAWYLDPMAYAQPGMAPSRADDVEMIRPVMDLLAKALLYLNLSEAEKRKVSERSDLERRRKGLGQKKQARLQRKLATAYDRIVIGPAGFPDPEAPQGDNGKGEAQRSVKAHWRRGHFRTILYGEKRSKQRLGWIKPVLVNAGQAFDAVKTKPYVVR
jgi:hypothetical protein